MTLITFIKTKDSYLLAGDDLQTINGEMISNTQKVFQIGQIGGIAFMGGATYLDPKHITTAGIIEEFARENKKMSFDLNNIIPNLKSIFESRFVSLDLHLILTSYKCHKTYLLKVSGNKAVNTSPVIKNQSNLIDDAWYYFNTLGNMLTPENFNHRKLLEFYFKLVQEDEMIENFIDNNAIFLDTPTGVKIIKKFYYQVLNDENAHKGKIGNLFNILILKKDSTSMMGLKKKE